MAPRTLVVSDLHLGARRAPDILRQPDPRRALAAAAAGCERLVLLGDLLEFRHHPAHDVLEAAEPVLRELGAALGSGSEVVLVPGNHDHMLLRGWQSRRALADGRPPLELENEVTWTEGEALARVAAWLEPARLRAAYPGVWLGEGLYATHGHYGDRHITVPILERLGAGAMARVVGEPVAGPRTVEEYEAILAPMYAWIDAVAQAGGPRGRGGGSLQVRAWRALTGSGRGRGRRLRGRALRAAFPTAVGALNRIGMGPLRADLSGPALRRGGLAAFAEVLARLGARPDYAIFGHTHRAGPLPEDDPHEWRTASGIQLVNSGCWVHGGSFLSGDTRSPYRPGFAVVVEADRPPELVNLLD